MTSIDNPRNVLVQKPELLGQSNQLIPDFQDNREEERYHARLRRANNKQNMIFKQHLQNFTLPDKEKTEQ